MLTTSNGTSHGVVENYAITTMSPSFASIHSDLYTPLAIFQNVGKTIRNAIT
jgi:hypothetical protein